MTQSPDRSSTCSTSLAGSARGLCFSNRTPANALIITLILDVSVYGLGRFPVTLYLEQWDALLSHAAELREFIEANKSRLKTKDQTRR